MGKKFFIYLAALAAALTVASPAGLDLMSIDRPASIHSANQAGGGGGP
jgi:hypothetical protein